MHTFSSERGASRARSLVSRRALWAGFSLAAASLAVIFSGKVTAQTQQQPPMGEPVNLYAANTDPYALRQSDGEIRAQHVLGKVWLMTGVPGETNVAVQLGDQGVLVVDSGTAEMAPKLLAAIQRLAAEQGVTKGIRMLINTGGGADHLGGNAVIRKAGTQVIGGEERAQQVNFGTAGAMVLGHENLLTRLVTEKVDSELWPTDGEGFDVDNRRFNDEPVQVVHPRVANTDSQLVLLFRASDVIAAGDLLDMTSYPVIDAARGGSIDGWLVSINRLIAMAVPANQAEGGTVIIPGHGRMADQSDVALYKNMITIIRNLVQYHKKEGKRTLEQVLAMNLTAPYDQRWGKKSGWTPRQFVTAIYQTLPADAPVFFSMKDVALVPSNASPAGGGRAF